MASAIDNDDNDGISTELDTSVTGGVAALTATGLDVVVGRDLGVDALGGGGNGDGWRGGFLVERSMAPTSENVMLSTNDEGDDSTTGAEQPTEREEDETETEEM
jgi:hypothetical protein